MSFATGWSMETPEGYSTWISGSPNYFVDGAVPLTASIPTHWWPDEWNMNWKITKIGEPVVFPEGMPFMFFQVYKEDLLPNVEFEIEHMWDKPELMKSRRTHSLQLAIAEIMHNRASVQSAATKYHIPRETLRRHYQR